MKDNLYMNASEAAAALNISLPTLYAYVSRGLIRSEETEGKTRAKRYHREDVAALQARKELRQNPAKAAEKALHWGSPVLESGITLIENGRFYYRGHEAILLPERHTFADVANLIWQGDLTDGAQFAGDISRQWQLVQQATPLWTGLTPMERFQVILPLAATTDLAAYDLSDTAVIHTAQRILNLLTTAVTGQPVTGSIAAALQQTWTPDDTAVTPLLETALIYCADHELNVSAFAARTVASAKATPYAVVIAGLAALQGSLHGGATERVEALFREVGLPQNARMAVASRLRRGEPIPGFRHPLYPDGDPRGRALLDKLAAVYPDVPSLQLARQIMVAVETAVGYQPTVDCALVTLAWAANLPPGAPLALFAIGRTVGWIGHALEQYGRDHLIRPRARYVGPLPSSPSSTSK
ncbi:MAG: MerR family transcriptional regulator [Chloroflexi bacterium]|nr:MerR family transcriptional regulator [Chloroflexota bacterium]